MNDPEVTMPKAATNTNLVAHEKALEAAGVAIKLVMRVPAPLKSIADGDPIGKLGPGQHR